MRICVTVRVFIFFNQSYKYCLFLMTEFRIIASTLLDLYAESETERD